MSTYSDFVRNPWNVLLRTLMIKVDEKKIEAMIKDGRSDVNYRNILLYVNNAHMDINDELSFDTLSSVNNTTTIIYIFDLDTYIIDNPYDITYSAINNIAIITKEYSQYSCVVWCNSLLLNSIVFITVSHSIRHCRILSVVLSLRMYIRTRSLHSLRMYSSSFPILYPLHMLQNILSSFILFIFGMPLTKAAFFLSVSLMVFESSVQQDILPFTVYSCSINSNVKEACTRWTRE